MKTWFLNQWWSVLFRPLPSRLPTPRRVHCVTRNWQAWKAAGKGCEGNGWYDKAVYTMVSILKPKRYE